MHLENNQIFPHITAKRVGGGEMSIPETYKDNGAYCFSTGEIGDPFAIGS
jgi:hypothetical protein